MNCNALENGLTILCHFFKFVIYSRSADGPFLIILDQEFTSLYEICVKTYASVQRFEQNIVRINATLQRIEQTVALMKRSEPAPRFEGAFVDVS